MGAKCAFDLITSSIGLVILSPVFLVIAGAIRYGTPGPVFYRGLRTGLNGMPFRIIKFRTLVPYAENLGG
jgi:lipopolysaccharide/colanic/teichoic acid biosynthesis glycosyltransferase